LGRPRYTASALCRLAADEGTRVRLLVAEVSMTTPSCEAKFFCPLVGFFFSWTCLLSLIVQFSEWQG